MWLFACWFVGVQTDGTWVTSWGIWVTSWGNGWTPHVKAHLSKSFMSYYTSKYLDVLMISILIWLYQHTYIDMWQHIYQTLMHTYMFPKKLPETNNTRHPKEPNHFFYSASLPVGPVCAMGFSAGGHLVASVASRRSRRLEAQALIYPCSLVGNTWGPWKKMALVVVSVVFWGGEKLPNLL